MCLQKFRERLPEPCAYSLNIPEYSLLEVLTVVVACCENNAIPTMRELEALQPLAYVLIPGAEIQAPSPELRMSVGIMHPPPQERHSAQFFESVLMNMPNVQDIIICTHNDCKYAPEQSLEQQLENTTRLLSKNIHFRRRRINLHAWHYEPEINWVSFLDVDTGLMLPLNANANLLSREFEKLF